MLWHDHAAPRGRVAGQRLRDDAGDTQCADAPGREECGGDVGHAQVPDPGARHAGRVYGRAHRAVRQRQRKLGKKDKIVIKRLHGVLV